MQEYFDIVDENNVLTDEKKLRSEAHITGLWHRTVHIYLFRTINGEFEFLVHLRSKTKDLHPNFWDTRFGGHLKTGESVQETVKSELLEEIGLEMDPSNLIEGEVYKGDFYPNREFTYTFYYKFENDIASLKFNDGEVQEIKWMKISEVLESMTKEPEIWSANKDGLIKVVDVLKGKLRLL